jgi:hypothetical protein
LCLVASLGLSACTDDDDNSTTTDANDSADTTGHTDTAGNDHNSVASSTAGVKCDYMDITFNDSVSVQADSESAWTCSEATRELTANGIPDHAVGTFPNEANPNTIAAQDLSISYSLDPVVTDTATEPGGPRGTTSGAAVFRPPGMVPDGIASVGGCG